MIEDQWWHQYNKGLKGVIDDASFAHPAKYAWGLINHIYDHAFAEGWLTRNALGLDPMAGIGIGGIAAANHGLRFLGIELEERFVAMGQSNIARHTREWLALGNPLPLLVQGDARQLRAIVEAANCIVSSPPYADRAANDAQRTFTRTGNLKGINEGDTYKPAAVVSSPPFLDARQDTTRPRPPKSMNGILAEKAGRIHRLGACEYGQPQWVVSSPPYSGQGQVLGGGDRIDYSKVTRGGKTRTTGRAAIGDGYGQSSGQLGALREGNLSLILTSPPYLPETDRQRKHEGKAHDGLGGFRNFYSDNAANLGNPAGAQGIASYWSEIAKIYAACHDVLPVGGHIILVVKGFVRRGVYQDLPRQTAQLLEHVGFSVLHYHHAMLSSPVGQARLFDDGEDRTRRASFFRRLAEQKGAPVIDHEAVLCAVKQ